MKTKFWLLVTILLIVATSLVSQTFNFADIVMQNSATPKLEMVRTAVSNGAYFVEGNVSHGDMTLYTNTGGLGGGGTRTWNAISGKMRIGTGNTACAVALCVDGNTQSQLFSSLTNCADSAGAAACGAAPAGAFVIDASATTVTVSTTAVTANSRILIQEVPAAATELGITCNTTLARTYAVTTLTAATSFVVTASAAPVTNPACLEYFVIN